MRRAAVAAVLLACGACVPRAAALPLISHHGRWLTDPQGRVVILHGVQIDKFMPTQPVEGWIDVPPSGVRFVAAEGFNVARVSLAYAGVEPQLGNFNDGYVQMFLSFDRTLAQSGVYDLIDMMQGEYSAVVGGGGFPAWMTQTNGLPNNHEPFPRGYIDNPAENAAWDNFWADASASDGVGFQDHFASGLHRLALQFASAPGLLAFDVFNEPWAGSLWPTCATPLGCLPGGFDQTALTGFYGRAIPALRSADARHLIAYEPNLLFDYGAATQLGKLADPGLLFAFHNYCLANALGPPLPDPLGDCAIDEQLVLSNADARAGATGDGLLMDEWGNSANLVQLNREVTEADQHMVGWSYWAYEDCCGSAGAIVRDGSKDPLAPGNLNLPVLNALVRPYPKLIAGIPLSWSFDQANGSFTFAYSARPLGADTEVELPALRYPTGYSVSVSGARVVSAPDANLLRLDNEAGATTVRLTVVPADHHPASGAVAADCPSSARLLVRLRYRRLRIVRVAEFVDSSRVAVKRGRAVRWFALPAGLADGTFIRLVATTAAGRRVTRTETLAGCRLPRRMWTIRRGVA
jgi:endoglycosylceramidase